MLQLRRCLIGMMICLALLGGAIATHAQQPAQTHVVQEGENLFRIGLLYGFSADQLARANNISDPTRIFVGQVLVLPVPIGGGEELVIDPPAGAPLTAAPIATGEVPPVADLVVEENPQPAPVVVEEAAPLPETKTHIVQANEGLSQIARAYGVSWVTLAQVNNITDPNVIHAGQVLTIPNPTLQPPADYGQAPAAAPSADRYILVELNSQQIKAYENGQLVRQVTVSTGLPGTPTVQGDYSIYSKLPDQTMYGPGYYLPGVPWVMYFYKGYAIHGTYWHSNFGQPMSHGCVNLPPEDARWFYEFASIGTLVRVVQ